MKTTAAIIMVLACSALVFGCADVGSRDETLNSWIGADINKLLTTLGPPTRTDRMPNGTTMYTYTESATRTTPMVVEANYDAGLYGPVRNGSTVTGGQTLQYYCTTTYFADRNNIVTNWRSSGNMQGCAGSQSSQTNQSRVDKSRSAESEFEYDSGISPAERRRSSR